MKKPEQYLKELKIILKRGRGVIHPDAVVKFARNPNTILHSAFEWNDGKAAELYRIEQARRLIRVIVDVIPFKGKHIKVQAFVALHSERYKGNGYRYLPEVMKTEQGRDDVLATALWELETFEAKYKGVEALTVVFRAIAKVKPILK